MAANLRRGNLPTADTMARFLYYIIKQLDVRGVDWTEVADNMDITNGHAARMRYARYKNQVEGVGPKPREPRPSSSNKKAGRPVKKQKVEKKEDGEEGVKKEAGGGTAGAGKNGSPSGAGKVKREGSSSGEGGQENKGMTEAKMSGALGQGAGVKREYGDVDAEGEETWTDDLNPMDLTIRTDSITSEQGKPPSRKGSGVKVKSEPADEGASPKRTTIVGIAGGENADNDAPGESINASELSALSLSQHRPSASPYSILAHQTSAHNSPHTTSLHLALSQASARSDTQPSPPSIPFTMQHLQLTNSASLPMQHSHTHTPPPPSHQLLSTHGTQSQALGSYAHHPITSNTYPPPAYFTQPMQALGQSPATTASSSAPFSLPPSPSGGGFNGDMGGGGYDLGNGSVGMAGGWDVGMGSGSAMMGHGQDGFVGMLEDPGFPKQAHQGQGGFFGGNGGFGEWEGMY